jgi:2-keto-4-pentenoate hydratase
VGSRGVSAFDAAALAAEMLRAWDDATLVTPRPTQRDGGLTLGQAFEVADRVRTARSARGERPVGWKIGFTNRTIWPRYGVHAPIWAPVWSSTLLGTDRTECTLPLAGLCQPRIEPEIVFGFHSAPAAGMDADALRSCLAWVAHGVEIVHTHCEAWRFEAADTVADFALHGRLAIGPRVPVQGWPTLGPDLAALRVTLACDGETQDHGVGANVLDGPLDALRAWLDAMAQWTPQWRVQAGEFVTTGTITDAWPLAPGQRWQTHLSDARLAGLVLQTTA